MMEEKTTVKQPHNIILQDRRDLSVSGVIEVISFDETSVCMRTPLGELTVHGQKLHIKKTSIDSGELLLDGEICELCYTAKSTQKQGTSLFAKMFK